jgi:hypothetical protein
MPKRVQLPNGKIGEFPDSMSNEDIEGVLRKQFPTPASAAPVAPTATAAPTSPAQTPETPGFFQRLGEGTGIPTSFTQIGQMGRNLRLGGDITGETMAQQSDIYWRNLGQQFTKTSGELKQAAENIRAGQPFWPNVGRAAGAETEYLTKGLLAPVGGAVVAAGREDIAAGHYAAAAGDAVATALNLLMLRSARRAPEEMQLNYLATAAGGERAEIAKAYPDLVKTAAGEMAPGAKTTEELPRRQPRGITKPRGMEEFGMGMEDFRKIVNKTKDRMNAESDVAMAPLKGRKTIPVQIAQKIRGLITPDMDMTPDGRIMKSEIQTAALPYETQEWTYEALDKQRQKSYARWHRSERPGYQRAQLDPPSQVDKVVNESIRDLIYPKMDAIAKKSPGYFQNLKDRQSALISLQEQLDEEIPRLQNQTAASLGTGRFREARPEAGIPTTSPGLKRMGLRMALGPDNPLAFASGRVAKGFVRPMTLEPYMARPTLSQVGRATYPMRTTAVTEGAAQQQPVQPWFQGHWYQWPPQWMGSTPEELKARIRAMQNR